MIRSRYYNSINNQKNGGLLTVRAAFMAIITNWQYIVVFLWSMRNHFDTMQKAVQGSVYKFYRFDVENTVRCPDVSGLKQKIYLLNQTVGTWTRMNYSQIWSKIFIEINNLNVSFNTISIIVNLNYWKNKFNICIYSSSMTLSP